MDSEKYIVRVHEQNQSERNPYKFVVIYLRESEIGPWVGIMRHRGIISYPLQQREMTADEKYRYKNSWRMMSYRYKNWEELINDEYAVTMDLKWSTSLYELSRLTKSFEQVIYRKDTQNTELIKPATVNSGK